LNFNLAREPQRARRATRATLNFKALTPLPHRPSRQAAEPADLGFHGQMCRFLEPGS
jgi:hypothetical protein